MQYLQKPAHGVEDREPLDGFGHVVDGKDEAAEQNRRHENEKGGEQGLLLGARGDADQQSQAEVAGNVDDGGQIEQGQAALDVNAEDQAGDDEHHGHGHQAGEQEGQGLAEDEFDAPDGGDHHLFDGADLLFPDDGHGGEHQPDEDQHQGDQSGHIVIFALQVGIVPGAYAHIKGRGCQGGLTRPRRGHAPVETGDGPAGVVEGNGRIVAQGAVHQKLNANRLARGQIGGEIVGDAQHGPYRTCIQQPAGAPVVGQATGDGKIVAAGELGHQFPTGRGVVRVDHRRGDVLDIGGQGEGQHHHLHDGHHQDHDAHAHIPEHLQKLFDEHLADAQDHSFSFIFLWHKTTIRAA